MEVDVFFGKKQRQRGYRLEIFNVVTLEFHWRQLKDSKCQVIICLQFPKSMGRLNVVCVWMVNF